MEKNDVLDQNKIIKNLCFDSDTGRFILTDNQNNSYICDMFGRKKSFFKSRITGISNRYERKRILQPLIIKNIKENKKTLSPLKYNQREENNFNTISNHKSINYHPNRRRYGDGCGLPKSLVAPFFNEKSGDLKEKNKKELIEHLNIYFSNEVCKNNVSLNSQNKNCALSYLTSDLNDYKSYVEDNKKIMKLIDDTIEEYREQYKNKLDVLYKNPVVKALKNFKKFLLLNQDAKVINGYKAKEPNDEIKEKYKIIDKNIKNSYPNTIERTRINDRKIELKIKQYLYSNQHDQYETEGNNIYNQIQNYNIIVGPDKLNNYCKSKDFTVGRLLEMDFGFTDEDKKNKLNRIKRLGNSAFKSKNSNNNIIKNRRIKLFSGHKKERKSDEEQALGSSSKVEMTYKDTVETLSNNNRNMSDININSNNNKSLEQKIKDNELSFISELSEREQKIQKKRKFRIKSVKLQRLQANRDNRLLNGYQQDEYEEEEKPETVKKEHKLKSFLECYKNDINLLKITNPKAYELQKKEEEREKKLMKKKMEFNALFEKNRRYNKKKSDE